MKRQNMISTFSLKESTKQWEPIDDERAATHIDLASGKRFVVQPDELESFVAAYPWYGEFLTTTFHFFFEVDHVDNVFLVELLQQLGIQLVVALTTKDNNIRVIIPELVVGPSSISQCLDHVARICQASASQPNLLPLDYWGEVECFCPPTIVYACTAATTFHCRLLSLRARVGEKSTCSLETFLTLFGP